MEKHIPKTSRKIYFSNAHVYTHIKTQRIHIHGNNRT